MLTVGCVQPSYIPWRGYFHIIQKSDVFVYHDDIQYTKQDWRNRNQIRTEGGLKWLTVPVRSGASDRLINEVEIDNDQKWSRKHWAMIENAYRKAPFFAEYADGLKAVYARDWALLSDLDMHLTELLAGHLGLTRVRFVKSSDLGVRGVKTERLIDILNRLGAEHYVSGPSAQDYIEDERFAAAGISLEYMTYDYPTYPQIHGDPFEPRVSVLDLLFNVGPEAPRYIWGDA